MPWACVSKHTYVYTHILEKSLTSAPDQKPQWTQCCSVEQRNSLHCRNHADSPRPPARTSRRTRTRTRNRIPDCVKGGPLYLLAFCYQSSVSIQVPAVFFFPIIAKTPVALSCAQSVARLLTPLAVLPLVVARPVGHNI